MEKIKEIKDIALFNLKKFEIVGINIWRLLGYFIIYSVIGFFVENIYALVLGGVIESRKSFLVGPFCSIYGVGAFFMIPALQQLKKNNKTLFFGGAIIGSAVEYAISLIGEIIFHVKWWDYSDLPFNINGRICIAYAFIWGLLSVVLMSYINPSIDKIVEKLKKKFDKTTLKRIILGIIIFMFLDFAVTSLASKLFYIRLVNEFDLNVQNKQHYQKDYEIFYQNETINKFIFKWFSDEVMLRTFPNLRICDANGDIIYISSLFPDIQTYYIKLFEPKHR